MWSPYYSSILHDINRWSCKTKCKAFLVHIINHGFYNTFCNFNLYMNLFLNLLTSHITPPMNIINAWKWSLFCTLSMSSQTFQIPLITREEVRFPQINVKSWQQGKLITNLPPLLNIFPPNERIIVRNLCPKLTWR